MIRLTLIALALMNLEIRAMLKLRGASVTIIRTAISIAPLIIVSLASVALNKYILKDVIQNETTLVAITNSLPVLALTNICRRYFVQFDKKFPRRIFNQTNTEIIIWKGFSVLLVSFLFAILFTATTYPTDLYLSSIVIFCVMTAMVLMLIEILDLIFLSLKKYNVYASTRSSEKTKLLAWTKYFLSFRWQDPNGQSGLFVSIVLFFTSAYFIEESLLLSLFLFSLSLLFIFFDLITDNILQHKVFIYSNMSSGYFFFSSYTLVLILYFFVSLLSFSLSFFAYGSTVAFIAIPVGFVFYTLYDSLASLSILGDGFRKITRRILLPLGLMILTVFNPIIGLALFAGTSIWLFVSFNNRWKGIPNDHQIE